MITDALIIFMLTANGCVLAWLLQRNHNERETIMAKLSELKGTVDEIKATAVKAFGEIRTKVDELNTRIEDLTNQLKDADIPADAEAALTELKAVASQLDDIVPDAPPPAS